MIMTLPFTHYKTRSLIFLLTDFSKSGSGRSPGCISWNRSKLLFLSILHSDFEDQSIQSPVSTFLA